MHTKTNLLKKISKAAVQFLEPLTMQETYQKIVTEAVKLIDADDGLIILQQPGSFKIAYASSKLAGEIHIREKGFTYNAIQKNEIFVLYPKDFASIHPQVAEQGVQAALFIPLSYLGKTIGVVVIRSYTKKIFSQEALDTLRVFGSFASLAIRKTQLYTDTYKALETRDLFIALASHELKTPLTTMSLYVQMLCQSFKDERPISGKWLESLAHETNRLTQLVNELLQINQIEKGQFAYSFTMQNLKKLLHRVVSDFKVRYPSHRLNFTNGVAGTTTILCDENKLFQVFTNLLTNGAKFSPPTAALALVLEDGTDAFFVKVVDKGQGIEKRDLGRIFDRFYKGKSNKQDGMGLGLFLAKTIIEKHNGEITIDSKMQEGTTVTIRLPKP